MTISVVIIDDHTLVRQGVVSLIQAEPDLVVVGEASSIAEGEALLASTRADVMLVDVSLPDGNGIELTRSVREQSPTMGIVVLTMHNDDETLLSALDAGASALVLKSASSEEVVDAVRRAAVAPDAFSASGLAGAMRRHQAAAMARPQLTPREQAGPPAPGCRRLRGRRGEGALHERVNRQDPHRQGVRQAGRAQPRCRHHGRRPTRTCQRRGPSRIKLTLTPQRIPRSRLRTSVGGFKLPGSLLVEPVGSTCC